MNKDFFKQREGIDESSPIDLQLCLSHLTFNSDGLIPVITQCIKTGEILMQAWMNITSIERTLESNQVTYWSRSRNQYWIKGETSGHIQHLKSMRFDCDGDVILCLVEQEGSACHTGRLSCFYLEVNTEKDQVQLCKPVYSETI